MNTNTTQLKQETLVGNDPVLEDIYPKTDAAVVYDNGVPMDQMIDRLWNAINNKLSRVVNSVNGRSGVVVLNKSDVGLSNVDNVSFADIKQWVMDQFAKANNHLQLVDDMSDIDELCGTNDKTLHNAPFFAEHGYQNDVRAYIGYIYWDDATSQLMHDERPIPTIGSTDMSIIYNETVGGKDYTNGKIGVNIAPGEKILKVKDTGDKSTSGLYIDEEMLSSETSLLKIDGVYGNGTPQDTTALLYFDESTTPVDAKSVRIYIDGSNNGLTNLKLRNTDLSKGTLILCDFKDYKVYDSSAHQFVYPAGMNTGLCGRTQAIGKVTQVPDEHLQINYYEINFYTIITQNPGWGLTQMHDHDNSRNTPTNYSITIDTAKAIDMIHESLSNISMSGLQVFLNPVTNQTYDYPSEKPFPDAPRMGDFLVTPRGVEPSIRGGLGVTTDYSISLASVGLHDAKSSPQEYEDHSTGERKPYGSKEFTNWASPMVGTYSEDIPAEPYTKGVTGQFSVIGVNLNKNIQWKNDAPEEYEKFHGATYRLANISGLRIEKGTVYDHVDQHDYNARLKEKENKTPEWYGMNYGDERINSETMDLEGLIGSSGGLSINVGQFLEIDPGEEFIDNNEHYYSSGKVNVRIGKGLKGEPKTYDLDKDPNMRYPLTGNRIQIRLKNGTNSQNETIEGVEGIGFGSDGRLLVKIDKTRGDLDFDENGNLFIVNPGGGEQPTQPSRVLRIKDSNNNTFDFNPSGVPITEETQIDELLLGPGLKITST